MKIYVLMFGFTYDGYVGEVSVYSSREKAEMEGKRIKEEADYDYWKVEEKVVIED